MFCVQPRQLYAPEDVASGVLVKIYRKAGDVMSLEVVEKVVAAEAANREKLESAKAEAKQLLEETEKRCQAMIKSARDESLELNKIKFRGAEERAQKRSEEILQEAAKAGDALKNAAAAHLAKASDLIVERITG